MVGRTADERGFLEAHVRRHKAARSLSDRFRSVNREICAEVGDACSGGGLKVAEAVAEFNPLDDFRQAVLTVELAPFLLRGHHQLEWTILRKWEVRE